VRRRIIAAAVAGRPDTGYIDGENRYSFGLVGYFWGLILAGFVYGVCAIAAGLCEVARLVWRWNAPLRTLKRP
jgi:hypothetical protein